MKNSWRPTLRAVKTTSQSKTRTRPLVEQLEDRLVPTTFQYFHTVLTSQAGVPLAGNGPDGGFSPSQIRQAYAISQISFGGVTGDGTGQTIAIVDAYNDPNIKSDLATFDSKFGIAAPPSFSVVNQTGGSSLPANSQGWAEEISLDVEWAHAVAPGAKILLVEAKNSSTANLLTAVSYASAHASVVSMSWGGGEFSGEAADDSYFSTSGVTFVASSGDNGAPSGWPAISDRVVSVGGTSLFLNSSNNWSSETGWSGSGGGPSLYLTQPSYQQGVVTQTTMRANPDVSIIADPNTGLSVYDSYQDPGWFVIGGTSCGAPMWSALFAIADQGRVSNGLGTLDSYNQTLPMLYKLPSSDFHDITSGNNGYSAGPGYDYVTGLGTPIANLVVAGLAGSSTGTVPPAPTNLVAAAGNAQVTLNWAASSGATSYDIYRGTSPGGEGASVYGTSTTTSFADNAVTNGTTYYYFVTAVENGVQSSDSNEASAKPQAPTQAPATPTGLAAVAGNDLVTLTWNASSGATSYTVYRATSPTGTETAIATVSSPTYQDSSVTNGTTYYYEVSASNSSGTSAASSQVSATPTGGGGTSTVINTTSDNWSGYAVSAGSSVASGASASTGVSYVQATWVVPTANASSKTTYSSAWVGIDGYNSNTVEQIGTDSDYIPGSGPSYYAWIELYPNDYWQWSLNGNTKGTTPPMKAGDVINAYVAYQVVGGKGQFVLDLDDVTAGYDYKATFTYATAYNSKGELPSNSGTLAFSLNGSSAKAYDPFLSASASGGSAHPLSSVTEALSANYTLNSRTGAVKKWLTNSDGMYPPVDRSSAEWIQESPGSTVTNFSPLVFSNAEATIGGVTGSISSSWPSGYSVYDIVLVNGSNKALDAVSALSNSGTSFTITYTGTSGSSRPATAASQQWHAVEIPGAAPVANPGHDGTWDSNTMSALDAIFSQWGLLGWKL